MKTFLLFFEPRGRLQGGAHDIVAACKSKEQVSLKSLDIDLENPKNIYAIIGKRIRAFRKALCITQEELAYKAGMTRVTLQNIESARHKTPLDKMIRIADVLNFDLRSFFPENKLNGDIDQSVAEIKMGKVKDWCNEINFQLNGMVFDKSVQDHHRTGITYGEYRKLLKIIDNHGE